MNELDHDALQKAYASLGDCDCPLLGVAIKTYLDASLKPMKDAPTDGTLIEAYFQHGRWENDIFVPDVNMRWAHVNRWVRVKYFHSKGFSPSEELRLGWWEENTGILFGNQNENSFYCWRPYVDPVGVKV